MCERLRKLFFISALVIVLTELCAVAKEWRGIVPLHSTRADVERLLNVKPELCDGNSCLYDFADKAVFVLYSAEPTCKSNDVSYSWQVPGSTVIEITVRFKTPQPLSNIETNLTKYTRAPDKEFPTLVYFANDEEGVAMETSGYTVQAITYYRASKDDKLRCPSKR